MKKEVITWIAALDSKHANFFKKSNLLKPKLELIEEIAYEPDLEHKKPGRTFDRMGTGRHIVEPHTDPRDVEKQHFITKIIHVLEKALKNHNFEKLIIVAPPRMLGMTVKHLSAPLKHKLVHKLAKNILDGKIANIEKYLNKAIDFRKLISSNINSK